MYIKIPSLLQIKWTVNKNSMSVLDFFFLRTRKCFQVSLTLGWSVSANFIFWRGAEKSHRCTGSLQWGNELVQNPPSGVHNVLLFHPAILVHTTMANMQATVPRGTRQNEQRGSEEPFSMATPLAGQCGLMGGTHLAYPKSCPILETSCFHVWAHCQSALVTWSPS